MSSVFEIPTGIPNLTDQIAKDGRQALHGHSFKGTWNSPYESSPVVVRFFDILNVHDQEYITKKGGHLRHKIKIWGRLQHEHILPLLGLFHGCGPLPGLVTPWMYNGTLTNIMRRRHNTLTRYERFCLLEDIASALHYRMSSPVNLGILKYVPLPVHANAIVHGNLASFNVFVDSHGRGFVRCSGYSRMLGEIAVSETQETHPGDFRWAAPELVKDRNNSSNRLPTSKSDVWSFGCIMIHILSGRVPWSYISSTPGVATRLVQNRVPQLPREIATQDSSFLQQCFSVSPADRPSADQILAFVREESSHCINQTPQTATGVSFSQWNS
ncbi:hypothetical protein AZE42_05981 [Rhizopogon vesiculosus]|uniref:Protein kinase domain-containing protein n=1 Tax=Rhizopogon vesiculosus TaxID=180088 RepID=A0A1J8Q6T3_9AGAM|nr:hypothetical protein AZE42_05981 [Rhizopogon vesiculosus]